MICSKIDYKKSDTNIVSTNCDAMQKYLKTSDGKNKN